MSQEERRQRRQHRSAALRAMLRESVRPLDDDDREALALLIKRGAEILSDGERSDEEIAELRELVEALATARKNTP